MSLKLNPKKWFSLDSAPGALLARAGLTHNEVVGHCPHCGYEVHREDIGAWTWDPKVFGERPPENFCCVCQQPFTELAEVGGSDIVFPEEKPAHLQQAYETLAQRSYEQAAQDVASGAPGYPVEENQAYAFALKEYPLQEVEREIWVDGEKVQRVQLEGVDPVEYARYWVGRGLPLILNLTPHEVVVYDASGSFVVNRYPPVGVEARLATESVDAEAIGGNPVAAIRFKEVTNLPAPHDNCYFVVSMPVAQVAKRRQDVIAPNTNPGSAVRDAEGKIKGVRGFARYS